MIEKITSILNFGPQHPAAHGVLRLILQLEGELITECDPHIGYLHRGCEYLCLQKYWYQIFPFIERLDYTSVITQTHCFSLIIDRILTAAATRGIQWYRTVGGELGRLLNHWLAVITAALDLGVMAPLFWGFEEREKIMEFVEFESGARMHAFLFKFDTNITWQALRINFYKFFCHAIKTIVEINSLLLTNKLWKFRLQLIGTLSLFHAVQYGITGPLGRASGVLIDWRLQRAQNYDLYAQLFFTSFVGTRGDCYDRFLLRMREILEALYILLQLMQLPIARGQSVCNDMFNLITHATLVNLVGATKQSIFVEAGKGLFGITYAAQHAACVLCHFRSPAFFNLQCGKQLITGIFLSDVTAILGSLDIVFGEIDR